MPTITQVFRAIKDIPINRYSFETIELLKASFEDWARQMRSQQSGGKQADGAEAEFDSYLVEVTFDAIKDPAERNSFRGIPTSYTLPERAQRTALPARQCCHGIRAGKF